MKIQKDTLTAILLLVMGFILFTNKAASMSLMAINFNDVSGWWSSTTQANQYIIMGVGGILFLTFIVQIWWREK